MMKFKRILSFILAAICVMTLFTACGPKKKDPITIISGGECTYSIVRPESCSDTVKNVALQLRDALQAVSSNTVTIREDFVYAGNEPQEYEILVGQTNRTESISALNSIKYNDYIISIEGNKLVINAYTDEKLTEAVNYVIGLVSGDTLTIEHDDQKTFNATYSRNSVSLAGVSVEGYTIIVPNKMNNSVLKSSASELQKSISEICGIYLPIKLDSETETEKEILIGDTNRVASSSVDAATLGEYGYSITKNGSKIVIKTNDTGFTALKLASTLADILSSSGNVNEGTGKVEISATPLLKTFMFTDVHNCYAMLEPTNNYKKYIVRKNVGQMIDYLLETEGQMDVVMVGGDLISDYFDYNSSGRWPYRYFVKYRELLVETFNRLAKDDNVMYVGGNHDYALGELATDGPGINGSYNSFDFYEVGMKQGMGELTEENSFWEIGDHTGEKYLLAYYYEVNGIIFAGLNPDHDLIWSTQGSGFNKESMTWLDKKLDELDPDGTKVIFVNCHYPIDNRHEINSNGTNVYSQWGSKQLIEVFSGHKNLVHIYGHDETWHSDTTSRYVIHYKQGNRLDVTGKETNSSQIVSFENRDFTAIYGGHFRPDSNSGYFKKDDKVYGWAGHPDGNTNHTHAGTATPTRAQGLYIEVYEDRIVFTMKNIGTATGYTTEDLIEPYTMWLYK